MAYPNNTTREANMTRRIAMVDEKEQEQNETNV